MGDRYYLPLTTTALSLISTVLVTTAMGSIERIAGITPKSKNLPAVKHSYVKDTIHAERVKFAADHGVADPRALAASVRYSPMANLLISVAIEESRGNPIAVGSSGELGAWQVNAINWGAVPVDINGQAWQAESIIRSLLVHTKGDRKKALARYNGGSTPPGRSYRYAERILKRTKHLQVAVTVPPSYSLLRQALFEIPRNTQIL